jgi:hypothetical protein
MHPIDFLRSGQLAVVAAALLFSACGAHGPTAVSPGTAVVVTDDAATTRMDPANILRGEIQGDRLRLQVEFGGGCARHEFSLLPSGIFMESNPPQMNVQLAHDAKGDPCRAMVTQELVFDLSPVRQAYQTAYGPGPGVVILHVQAPGGGSSAAQRLRYEF